MNDIDLIAGSDSPFDPWVRDAVAKLRAKVARVEALCDAEDERARKATEKYAERGIIEPKSGKPLRLVGIVSTSDVRAALGES